MIVLGIYKNVNFCLLFVSLHYKDFDCCGGGGGVLES